jgi:hypothetical protein
VELSFNETIEELHTGMRNIMKDYGIPPLLGLSWKDSRLLDFIKNMWGPLTYGDDVWTKVFKVRLGKALVVDDASNLLVIVDDCQLRAEFDAFPEAVTVRLNCAPKTLSERNKLTSVDINSVTETDLDRYANEKLFDLNLDSSKMSEEEISAYVMDFLEG